MTECIQEPFAIYRSIFSRRVEASFTGGQVSSEGGSLLLREAGPEDQDLVSTGWRPAFTDTRRRTGSSTRCRTSAVRSCVHGPGAGLETSTTRAVAQRSAAGAARGPPRVGPSAGRARAR